KQIVITVPAGDAQGRTAHEHPGAGDVAGVDGITKRDISVAVCGDVAHGSESGFEGDAGIVCADERFSRYRNCECFVSELRVEGEMRVCVDQPGKDGCIRKVDQVVRRRSFRGGSWANTFNLVASNYDCLIARNFSGLHIEHFSSVDDRTLLSIGRKKRNRK